MKLLPVYQDESKNKRFAENPDCKDFLQVYPGHYKKSGYEFPWIGYFIANEKNELIGCGGFKGKPENGKVEIAYGTFPAYKGQGIGTKICKLLIAVAQQADPKIQITARTLREDNASTHILKKNGFNFAGPVFDDEDGDVWEWKLNTNV